MRTAGVLLDIYDDPEGSVLRETLAGAALPAKIASSQLLEWEELNRLPDRLFALVASDGDDVIRKYAMHDAPHLITSLVYFMKQGAFLPDVVRAKVAANLVNACAWYEIDPPDGLVKQALSMGKALVGGTLVGTTAATAGVIAKKGTVKRQQGFDAFRRAQMGEKQAAGTEVRLSREQDRLLQEGASLPSHVEKALAKRNQQPGQLHKLLEDTGTKKADLNGTEIMPHGALSVSVRTSPNKRVAMPAKTSAAVEPGWQHAGDVTRLEPPVRTKAAKYAHFALPHLERYPIDTPSLLKKAQAYFDEHLVELPLLERRVFAQSLHLRAQELGEKLAGAALDYAGNEYGPHIAAELLMRERSFAGTGHEVVYEALRDKIAEIDPRSMVELLKEADTATGAAQSYGRPGTGFQNPYVAVYGGVKEAAKTPKAGADTFTWSDQGAYVTGAMLEALVACNASLDSTFGDGFQEQFAKDPVGLFKSLPDPQKLTLARMASDNSGVTFRI
jgi:hypothetical protein